jgi:hypothetical protein
MGKHYVGISGVATVEQQQIIVEIAKDAEFPFVEASLLLGVKATETTQWHDQPNKYGRLWYPVGEEFRHSLDIEAHIYGIETDPDLIYAGQFRPNIQFYFGDLINNRHRVTTFALKALERAKNWERYAHSQEAVPPAVQLDMFPWMDAEWDSHLRGMFEKSNYGLILQCHSDYMQEFHPYQVVRRLRALGNLGVTGTILFDSSHGRGIELDPEALRPFVGAVTDSELGNNFTVGIAGGLSGDNVEEIVQPLLEEFGELSWDAEGSLHYKDGENDGDFNLLELERYIRVSAAVLKEYAAKHPIPTVRDDRP